MKNTIQLTLTGRQRDESGEETVTETRHSAEYYERNGSIYILYEEIPEDAGAAIQNCIKLKGSVLEITKKGAVSARMVFEAGREYPTDYATPYGCIKIGIRTESLKCLHSEEGLSIRAEYSLTSQGQPFSYCSITIAIDTKNSGKRLNIPIP